MVAIYFAIFIIYFILYKEKNMEKFNSELMANRGNNKQLVQCWLTKIDTAQHIGLAICTDWGGNIGREKNIQYY